MRVYILRISGVREERDLEPWWGEGPLPETIEVEDAPTGQPLPVVKAPASWARPFVRAYRCADMGGTPLYVEAEESSPGRSRF